MKNPQHASRAQLRQRQSFVAEAKASIAKRKRRRKVGKLLNLPTDKATLRKALDAAAAAYAIERTLTNASPAPVRCQPPRTPPPCPT